MTLYAMYKKTYCVDYDFNNYEYSELLAVDIDECSLKHRWNDKQDSNSGKLILFYPHCSRIEYRGSVGGGYADVIIEITIEPLIQWDH